MTVSLGTGVNRIVGVGSSVIGGARVDGSSGSFPQSLFIEGRQGFLHDRYPTGTVYQDAALTTLAGDLDPAGGKTDDSGNGNTMTQTSASAKPQFQTGSPNILRFVSDDYLVSSVVPDFTEGTLALVWTPEGGAVACGCTDSGGETVRIRFSASGTTEFRVGTTQRLTSVGDLTDTRCVVIGRWDASDLNLNLNDTDIGTTPRGVTPSTQPMYLGCLNNAGSPDIFATGDFEFAMLINHRLTADELADLISYLG